jgi:hypothetical protein
VNKFASARHQPGRREIAPDTKNPWTCFNSDMERFKMKEHEAVLDYWKRMSEEKEMKPLAMVARDVLGLASSSSSVERLFSHAGHVLGRKRGSLSAKKLVKQCSLRMWEGQGFFKSWDI